MSSNFHPLSTIATLLDISPRRVQQLAKEGVIPKGDARGQYNLVGAVQGYIRYLQNVAQAGDASGEYGAQRARLTRARADMAEMEREQIRKELVPADDIEGAWTAAAAIMRSTLLNIPAKLAPRMIGLKDANAARELIEGQVHEALKALAAVTITVSSPIRASDASADPDLGDKDAGAAAEADDLAVG